MQITENRVIAIQNRIGREPIAAIRPDPHRRMLAQHRYLRLHAFVGDSMVLGAPLTPHLPLVTAHPSKHQRNSLLVGQIDDVLARNLRFPTQHVEP